MRLFGCILFPPPLSANQLTSPYLAKAKRGPSPSDAVTKLQEAVSVLEGRSAYLVKKGEDAIQEAKTYSAAGNKKGRSNIPRIFYLC